MAYDYREAVKDDVLEYINNEINFEDFDTLEELEEHLNEVLFTEDSVTGNASGSYTFNTYEAETFEEALNAFEFYNLRGKETGRYTAFYIPVREVDRFTGEAPTAATLGTVTQYDYRYIGGFTQ